MADAIGMLGLDTKDIEAGLSRVEQKLTGLAVNARGANTSILTLAAGVAVFAKSKI